jgi:hypothetical protein
MSTIILNRASNTLNLTVNATGASKVGSFCQLWTPAAAVPTCRFRKKFGLVGFRHYITSLQNMNRIWEIEQENFPFLVESKKNDPFQFLYHTTTTPPTSTTSTSTLERSDQSWKVSSVWLIQKLDVVAQKSRADNLSYSRGPNCKISRPKIIKNLEKHFD